MQTLPITVTPVKNGYVAECRVFGQGVRVERAKPRAAYREALKLAEWIVAEGIKLHEGRLPVDHEVQFRRVDQVAPLISRQVALKPVSEVWAEAVKQVPKLIYSEPAKGPPPPGPELGIVVDGASQTLRIPGPLFDKVTRGTQTSPEVVVLPWAMVELASLGNQQWILDDLELRFNKRAR